jgi:hypothetical protein
LSKDMVYCHGNAQALFCLSSIHPGGSLVVVIPDGPLMYNLCCWRFELSLLALAKPQFSLQPNLAHQSTSHGVLYLSIESWHFLFVTRSVLLSTYHIRLWGLATPLVHFGMCIS